MAKITYKKYGYREYNNNGEKWDLLETNKYLVNSDIVINALYEKFGDRLWNSITNLDNKTMVISITDFSVRPCIEIEITIIE